MEFFGRSCVCVGAEPHADEEAEMSYPTEYLQITTVTLFQRWSLSVMAMDRREKRFVTDLRSA